MLSSSVNVYSFDVFDTVITRMVARPIDVFRLVQTHLLNSFIGYPAAFLDNFPRDRIKAERVARKLSNREDITIDDIYKVLADKYRLTDTQKKDLIAAEIACELKQIVPIKRTIDEITRIRSDRNRVIFVSDMYLPKEVINQMLMNVGAYRENDELYVSGEIGLTKATGSLYRYILDKKNFMPEQLIHYGDNIRSDVNVPRRLGIQINTAIKNNLALSSRESEMYRSVTGSDKLKSAIVGISRASRLNSNLDNKHHQAIWDTATDIIGPVFYFYVWWILQTARQQGIECLYFMSRDGHILHKIASIIEEKFNFGIELRYLYVSRESLLIPAVSQSKQLGLNKLITHLHSVSIHGVCRILDINAEGISLTLKKYGFAESRWDAELSAFEIQRLLDCFREEDVRTLIAANNQQRYLNVLGYLKQEGMSRSKRFALIDIGWEGHSQLALSSILHEQNERPETGVIGFYFGFARRLQVFGNDSVLSFCADNNIRKVLTHYGIFEVFASADHGKTIGYKFENNMYVPILNSITNKEADTWGISVQQQGILNFCKLFSRSVPPEIYDTGTIRQIVRLALFRFHRTPTRQEAEAYGSYLFSGYLKETGLQDIAPKMSRNEFWGRLFKGDKLVSLWFPGTFTRSSLTVEGYLWKLNMLKRELQLYLKVLYGPQNKFYFKKDIRN